MTNSETVILAPTENGPGVVLVVWTDRDETPLQAIGRLNQEVIEMNIVQGHGDAPPGNFVVTENTPGYLPESDPAYFQTFDEAVDYARDELNRARDEYEQPGDSESWRSSESVDWVAETARFDYESGDLGRVIEVSRVPFD